MAPPTRPIPDEQLRRFNMALADHLGLDPHRLTGIEWVIDGNPEGKARVTWTGVDLVDEQVVLDLFNGAGARGE